jgi:S-(hydroxymethyl)glutathione dehydrogenase/alcohol dehydrogenase
VQTSRTGSNQFRIDIPNYLEFYKQGRLDLDSMISRLGTLGDINEAFRAMKAGRWRGRCCCSIDGVRAGERW